jgi:hypothetical protein
LLLAPLAVTVAPMASSAAAAVAVAALLLGWPLLRLLLRWALLLLAQLVLSLLLLALLLLGTAFAALLAVPALFEPPLWLALARLFAPAFATVLLLPLVAPRLLRLARSLLR